RTLNDRDYQNARDAESDRQTDKHANYGVGHGLSVHCGEKLRVRLDPTVSLDTGCGLHVLGNVFCGPNIGDSKIYRRHTSHKLAKRLRSSEGDKCRALI